MRPAKVILLLDADKQRRSLRRFVLKTRGYRVVSASTHAWAIARILKGGIDMLMVDDSAISAVGVSAIASKANSFDLVAKAEDGLKHAKGLAWVGRVDLPEAA